MAVVEQEKKNGTELDKPKTELQRFHDLIQTPDVKNAMQTSVPNHIKPERLARIAYNTYKSVPALRDCSAISVLMCVMECAQLGLEPSNILGLAYLVPFDNKQSGRKEAQLIIGYKGKMELARRSKQIAWITAEVVYEKDKFTYQKGLHPDITHVPYEGDDPGPLKYAYAVAGIKGSEQPIFVVLTKRDVEKRRAASKSGKSEYSPWSKWPEAMWRKSSIHALAPYLPLSAEIATYFELEDKRDMGLVEGNSFIDAEYSSRATPGESLDDFEGSATGGEHSGEE